MKKRFFLLFLIYLGLLLFNSGCATVYNPATGRREHIFINSAEEVQIGRSLDKQIITTQYPLWNNPIAQRKIKEIGQRVAAVSDRRDIIYYFQVLDSPDYNAFALPGGYIYIYRGLYDHLKEDEIAAVLAHEIGHIAAKHPVKQMQSALGYNLIASLVFLGMGNENPELAREVGALSDTFFDLLSKGYGREDELFADKLSVKYLRASGYDPNAMVRSLEFLSKEQGPGGRVFEVLSTHPRLDERIKKVKEEIAGSSK